MEEIETDNGKGPLSMTATKLWLSSLLLIAGAMVTGCGRTEPPPPPPPKITKEVYEKVSLAISKAKNLKQIDKILAKVKITADDYNNCVANYGTPRWQRK